MKSRIAVSFLIVSCALLLSTACENPATGKPEAQVSEPDAAAVPAAVEGREFVISGESTIGFVGSKITGSHDGGFNSFEGTIVLAEAGPAASKVELVIDATSLWADDDRLTLRPGQIASYAFAWDQKDDRGRSVPAGQSVNDLLETRWWVVHGWYHPVILSEGLCL